MIRKRSKTPYTNLRGAVCKFRKILKHGSIKRYTKMKLVHFYFIVRGKNINFEKDNLGPNRQFLDVMLKKGT